MHALFGALGRQRPFANAARRGGIRAPAKSAT
jgi:hypothetical protein